MSPFSLAAFQSQVVCFCSDSCIKSIFCAKPSDVIQILLAQKDASKTEKNSFRVSFYSRCKHTAVLQWCNVRFSGAIILILSQFAWFCLHSSDATESKWVCPFSPRKWVWMGRWDIVSKTSLASDVKFQVQCFLTFCIFQFCLEYLHVSLSLPPRLQPRHPSPKRTKTALHRNEKKAHCPREDPTSLCNQWCH